MFVDTSVLYIALDEEDDDHAKVAETVRGFADDGQLVTHNYVVAESAALVERRLGRRYAVRLLRDLLAPVETFWVDEAIHNAASSAFLAAGSSGASLVDFTSFEVMRVLGVRTALAVDRDFERAGFDVIPA